MRIIFYEEIANPSFWDSVTSEERIALETLEEGIYQRIKILESQIDAEELKEEAAAVVVYLHLKTLQPKNYSPQLTNRINDSLDPSTVTTILNKVEKALLRFLN